MIVTRDYIFSNTTDKGSWTQPQLEALGVNWPPRGGWIDRVVGTHISETNKEIFESKIPVRQKRNKEKRSTEQELDMRQLNELRRMGL